MSNYLSSRTPVIGENTPYPDLAAVLDDRSAMRALLSFLDLPSSKLIKDSSGRSVISGPGGVAQACDAANLSYLIYISTYSERKWGAIKRKAARLGLTLTQDGDLEGCFTFQHQDATQAKFIRQLLRLRKRPASTTNAMTK